MSEFFEETMQGLLEACAIEKGIIPIVEKNNMQASTFVAEESPIIWDEKSEEVSAERIAEIRKGMDLIGEDILKERFEAKRNLLLEQVICINKQLKAGVNVEKIIDSGYPEWLVERVYQEIFCGNRREENE